VKVALGIENPATSPQVLLTVRDEGPGVPRDALQNIFSPFFRIKGLGRQSQGNGLGLADALEAIRLHHGTIVAANLVPRGLELASGCPRRPPPQSNRLIVGSPWYTRFQTSCISAPAVNQCP